MEKVIKNLKIDPAIFTHRFVKGCDISICGGECCKLGVYTDKKEMEFILENKELIKEYMDESQTKDDTKWFEPLEEDSDFASGECAGTEVFNHKCVFLDSQGFCTLQKMAFARNEPKWKYKPIYCVLFPLCVFEGALVVDDDHLGRVHYCNKNYNHVTTVFEACQEELKHLLGEDGFDELLAYKKEFENNTKIIL